MKRNRFSILLRPLSRGCVTLTLLYNHQHPAGDKSHCSHPAHNGHLNCHEPWDPNQKHFDVVNTVNMGMPLNIEMDLSYLSLTTPKSKQYSSPSY